MGARSKAPVKPDILVVYEKLKKSGLPLWSGGYIDQPYLAGEFLQVAANAVETMEYIQNINEKNKGTS